MLYFFHILRFNQHGLELEVVDHTGSCARRLLDVLGTGIVDRDAVGCTRLGIEGGQCSSFFQIRYGRLAVFADQNDMAAGDIAGMEPIVAALGHAHGDMVILAVVLAAQQGEAARSHILFGNDNARLFGLILLGLGFFDVTCVLYLLGQLADLLFTLDQMTDLLICLY